MNDTLPDPIEDANEAYETPITPFTPAPAKRNRYSTRAFFRLLAIVLVIVLIVMGVMLLTHKKATPKKAASNTQAVTKVTVNTATSTTSKFNRSGITFAGGLVNFEASKLKKIDGAVPKGYDEIAITNATTDLSKVLLYENRVDTYTDQLLMYDFGTKQIYQVAEFTNFVGHIYNPTILGDHSVAFYKLTYNTPVDLVGSVNILDLNTGTIKELLSDKAGTLASGSCCTVSPNGNNLVIQIPPNKLDFYSAGGDKLQELTTSVTSLAELSGPGVAGMDDYAKASYAANSGYPQPKWMDDSHILMAGSAPLKYSLGSGGEPTTTYIANGLTILDITTGTFSKLAQTSGLSVAWFDVSGTSIVLGALAPVDTPSRDADAHNGDMGFMTLDSSSPAAELVPLKQVRSASNPLAFDSVNNILYLEDLSGSDGVTAINLKSNTTSRFTIGALNSYVYSAFDSDTLVIGNSNRSTLPTQFQIYKISTDAPTPLAGF